LSFFFFPPAGSAVEDEARGVGFDSAALAGSGIAAAAGAFAFFFAA
jgi:hypothetical protein